MGSYNFKQQFEGDFSQSLLMHPQGAQPATDQDVFKQTNWPEQNKEYFHIMPHEQAHAYRKRAMLAKYPQIKKLMTKDPMTFYMTIVITVTQLLISSWVQHQNCWVFAFVTYCIGATLNHSTYALVHDLTHFLAFDSPLVNRIGAIICNIPSAIPSAIAFGQYHADHHISHCVPVIDTDLPTEWEIKTFNTWWKQIIFCIFLPLFYAIRPFIVNPKPISFWELVNVGTIFTSNYLIYTYIGKYALLYLFLSGLLGMGLHPCAAHTIAEHYQFVKGLETYDYFGPLNLINFNLGYHTEHHDFPSIPWSNLPQIRKIAPEFYEGLPYHTSYVKVFLNFIFDNNIGPYSRIENSQLQVKAKKN